MKTNIYKITYVDWDGEIKTKSIAATAVGEAVNELSKTVNYRRVKSTIVELQ